MKHRRWLSALALLLALLLPAAAMAEIVDAEQPAEVAEAGEPLAGPGDVESGTDTARPLEPVELSELSEAPAEPAPQAEAPEAPEMPEAPEAPADGMAALPEMTDDVFAGMARGTASEEADDDQAEWAAFAAPNELSSFPEKLCMGLGESLTLDATQALGGRAVYRSSNPAVVTVDTATGKVKAQKKGTAIIAAMNEQKQLAYCNVAVLAKPKRVSLSRSVLALNPGADFRLDVRLPKRTASATLTFTCKPEGVATVDASGVVHAVRAGEAVVTVATYNEQTASCKVIVLDGAAPKGVSLSQTTALMGKKEKLQLTPVLEEGAAAAYAWSSSNRKVATVSASGVVTAKRKGTAKITVTTHNGMTATCAVKVVKAPGAIKLSKSQLKMKEGDTARLTATLPSGTASRLTWKCEPEGVVTVDDTGVVTAVKAGKARITVSTFNNQEKTCDVWVLTAEEYSRASGEIMADRLRKNSAVGEKREALANIVQLLVDNGFEPAFAAGVAANVKCEGSYGFFESSRYISNPKARPRYFAYLDGGEYWKNGVLNTVYLSKEEYASYQAPAGVTKALRLGEGKAPEKYYWNKYSKKYAWEVNLTELEKLLDYLEEGGWVGKFGLGITQWTGGRTKGLVKVYRKHAGNGSSSITQEQVIAAENEMIVNELKTTYAFVYNNWKDSNSKRTGADAAASAGSIFCLKYEVPANKETAARTRAGVARTLYGIMMG